MSTFGGRLSTAIGEAVGGGRVRSKREIARRIQASSHSRLDDWVAGEGSPTVTELVALAQTLGVTVGWLAEGKEPKWPIPLEVEVTGFRKIAAIVDRVRATPLTDAAEVADLGEEALPDDEEGGATSAGGRS